MVVCSWLRLFGFDISVMSVWLMCLRMVEIMWCLDFSWLIIGVSCGLCECRCGKMLWFFRLWWFVMMW